jgi:hypothetical protein
MPSNQVGKKTLPQIYSMQFMVQASHIKRHYVAAIPLTKSYKSNAATKLAPSTKNYKYPSSGSHIVIGNA